MAIKLLRLHWFKPPKIAWQFSEQLVQINSTALASPWGIALLWEWPWWRPAVSSASGAEMGLCPGFGITKFLALSPQIYALQARCKHSVLSPPTEKGTNREMLYMQFNNFVISKGCHCISSFWMSIKRCRGYFSKVWTSTALLEWGVSQENKPGLQISVSSSGSKNFVQWCCTVPYLWFAVLVATKLGAVLSFFSVLCLCNIVFAVPAKFPFNLF